MTFYNSAQGGVATPINGCTNVPITTATGAFIAACSTGSLPLATSSTLNSITAAYSNDPNFSSVSNVASTPATITVTAGTTTIALSSSGNTLVNQAVTFSANVSEPALSASAGTLSGAAIPTGTVTFYSIVGTNTTPIPDCTGIASAPKATCTTSSLTAGTYNVYATYSGDTNFSPVSASALPATDTLTQQVNPSPVTVTVVPTSASIVATTSTNFIVTLSPTYTSPILPHGTVIVSVVGGGDGTTPSCSIPVAPTIGSTKYTFSCPMPITFPAGGATAFQLAASYVDTGGNTPPNFTQQVAATNSLVVEDFSITPPATSSTLPGVVYLTPGYSVGGSASTDKFFAVGISALTTELLSNPATPFADALSFSCSVAIPSGQTEAPTCTVGSTTATVGQSVVLIFSADSKVPPRNYVATLMATDVSTGALIRTSSFTVSVVFNAPQFSVSPGGTTTVNQTFVGANSSDLFSFACAQIFDLTSGSMVTAGADSIQCQPPASGTLSNDPFVITVPGSKVSAKLERGSPRIIVASMRGFPLLVLLGLLVGLGSRRRSVIRLFVALIAIAGCCQLIGCGSNGGFQPPPPLTSTVLNHNFLIQTTATDETTKQVYYSVIQVAVN